MIAFLLFSRSTLFRGAQSTLICVAVSNFVYFYTFHGLKGWTQQFYRGSTSSHSKSASTLRDLTFACAAGKYYTRTIIMKHVIWYYKFKGVTKTLDIVILVGFKKWRYYPWQTAIICSRYVQIFVNIVLLKFTHIQYGWMPVLLSLFISLGAYVYICHYCMPLHLTFSNKTLCVFPISILAISLCWQHYMALATVKDVTK